MNHEADTDSASEQTPHHYELAHVALRQHAQANSKKFVSIMASDRQRRFLDDIWKQVRANCDGEDAPPFDISDLKISAEQLGCHAAILIQMPPANFAGEAIFVGVVLAPADGDANAGHRWVTGRYFTLERGAGTVGSLESTWLCEWRDDVHRNYGPQGDMTMFGFLEALSAQLSSDTG